MLYETYRSLSLHTVHIYFLGLINGYITEKPFLPWSVVSFQRVKGSHLPYRVPQLLQWIIQLDILIRYFFYRVRLKILRPNCYGPVSQKKNTALVSQAITHLNPAKTLLNFYKCTISSQSQPPSLFLPPFVLPCLYSSSVDSSPLARLDPHQGHESICAHGLGAL